MKRLACLICVAFALATDLVRAEPPAVSLEPAVLKDLASAPAASAISWPFTKEIRHAIGGGLSLYGSVKGMVRSGNRPGAQGQAELDPETALTAEEATLLARSKVRTDRSEPVPVVELKLGAQWSVDLRRSALFFQTTWVGQHHLDLGWGPGSETANEGLNLALGWRY